MALCENVYRRGGVYWRRARFGGGGAPSRTVAISLGTRDPAQARQRGWRLTAIAAELRQRQRLRVGVMSMEEIRSHFVTDDGLVFHFAPGVVERFIAQQEAREPPPIPTGRRSSFTPEDEHAMLVEMGRIVQSTLADRVAAIRGRAAETFYGRPVDHVGGAVLMDRVNAEVCRLLATRGSSAMVRTDAWPFYKDKGFNDNQIALIDREAQRHARYEASEVWSLGPPHALLVDLLNQHDVTPTRANVRALRRSGLFLFADLLEPVDDRYLRPPPDLVAVLHAIRSGVTATAVAPPPATGEAFSPGPALPALGPEPRPPAIAVLPQAPPSGASFIGLVEALMQARVKARMWTPKTACQHRSIASLFVKRGGSDDPASLGQKAIGAYVALLSVIPKNWGKSRHDGARTIHEILARSEDLDDEEIGLAPTTHERHLTQLGTILDHVAGHGYAIGTIPASAHQTDPIDAEDKRAAFTRADGDALFHGRVWVGGVRDGLFWVPLICWYMLTRLGEAAGLMIDDVDFDAPAFLIRDNAIRRVKNTPSRRRLPVPPALLRLGIMDHLQRVKTAGESVAFPDLVPDRRHADPAARFQKRWGPELAICLPQAREQKKSLHSMRKAGNTAMANEMIPDAVRHRVLGHAIPGVNAKHYLANLDDTVLLAGLACIPNVTAHLE